MQSMTGFGSIGQSTGSLQIAVRLRSVNHKHLDLVLRMPEEIRPLELEMRERIGKRFSRGRIELRVDLEDRRDHTLNIHVNRSWITGIQKVSQELREAELDLSRLSLGDLLRIPDAVRISADLDEQDDERDDHHRGRGHHNRRGHVRRKEELTLATPRKASQGRGSGENISGASFPIWRIT